MQILQLERAPPRRRTIGRLPGRAGHAARRIFTRRVRNLNRSNSRRASKHTQSQQTELPARPGPTAHTGTTCPRSPAVAFTVTTVAFGKKLNSDALAQV